MKFKGNLTVFIPNYNDKPFLKECLESVKNQNYQFEVIVIRNASQDKSVDYIRKNYPEFTIIENLVNIEFAAVVNQGIKTSIQNIWFF